MKQYPLILLASLFLLSCGQKSGVRTNDNGDRVYFDESIGWEMIIPEGWEVLPADTLRKMTAAAANYYEDAPSIADKPRYDKKMILGLRKTDAPYNALYAFTRVYGVADDAKQPDMQNMLDAQYASYDPNRTDSAYHTDTSLRTMMINGREFEVAKLIATKKATDQQQGYTVHYITYSTMIDSVNFGVSMITYTENASKTLIQHFEPSIRTLKK